MANVSPADPAAMPIEPQQPRNSPYSVKLTPLWMPRNPAAVSPATTSTSITLLTTSFSSGVRSSTVTAKEYILTLPTTRLDLQDVVDKSNVLRVSNHGPKHPYTESNDNDDCVGGENHADLVISSTGNHTEQIPSMDAFESKCSRETGNGPGISSDAMKSCSRAAQTRNSAEAHKPREHVYQDVLIMGQAQVHMGDLIIQGPYYAGTSSSVQYYDGMPAQIAPPLAVFEDALGRISHIDISFISDWKGFEYLLRHRFDNINGARRVASGMYRLADEYIKQLLDPSELPPISAVFAPGRKINMSIHYDWHEVSQELCPRCGHQQASVSNVDTLCMKCDFVYRHESQSKDPSIAATSSPKRPLKPTGESLDRPEFFNRISIGARPRNLGKSRCDSRIPRLSAKKASPKVSALAKHFEQLSREFEKERLKEQRLRTTRSRSASLLQENAKPTIGVTQSIGD